MNCYRYIYVLFTVFFFLGLQSCKHREEEKARLQPEFSELPQLVWTETMDLKLNDTSLVDRQIDMAQTIWKKNKDSAQNLLWDAARASYKLRYTRGVVNALAPIANAHTEANNLDSTLFYCRLLGYFAQQIPKQRLPELIYANIAVAYYKQGMFDSAYTYIYKAINPLKMLQSTERKSWANIYSIYQIAGTMWINSNDPEAALTYLKKAGQMADSLQDPQKKIQVRLLLATIHFRKRQYDTAMHLYKEVLHNKASNDLLKINCLENMANLYLKIKPCNPDSAIYLIQRTIQIGEKKLGRNVAQMPMALYILAHAYSHKAEHENDSSYYLKAEQILRGLDSTKLNDIVSAGELPKFYANQGIILSINHKKYKEANELLRKSLELQDSLYTIAGLQERTKMDALFRIAERDKTLAEKKVQLMAAEKDAMQKKQLLLFTVIGAIVIITVLFLRYLYVRQKNQRLSSNREMELLKARLSAEEQERERISYDLHDSVNSKLAATHSFLIALQQGYPFLVKETDFNRVEQNLKDISTDVRQITHNLAPPNLKGKNLPSVIRDFCNDLLTPRNISCEVQVMGNFEQLPDDYCIALYRIIQELTHNIVKHAEATDMIVILTYKEGCISLLVEDNGKGEDWPEPGAGRTGIGILGLQSRIRSLNATLHKEVRPGSGTTIHITAQYP